MASIGLPHVVMQSGLLMVKWWLKYSVDRAEDFYFIGIIPY